MKPGDTLGPYRVLDKLGEGGMGEVYRALDTTLHREVALKIILASVAADPDRMVRFTREAKTLASLNHPNIAQIHGFEQSGDSRALVMELVHGEDLSRRCARGAIPLDEALAIARQICAALDAAHERGVIHRDLKPANIKLRDDGTVKVLDFGLAKAVQPGSAAAVEADAEVDHLPSATISASGVSLPGSIVGTAAYMSPEQARGKAVDERADIWAFGCVLYEMLAGVRAFRGSDLATIVSNVLTTEPDWSALPAGTPASIRRLLRRCLQKDPARRLRHIGDAALEMKDSLTESRLEEIALPAAHSEKRTGSLRMLRLALMTGVLVLSAAGLFAWSFFGRRAPEAAEMRLEISTPATDNIASLAISPDGQTVAFVALDGGRARLWLRPLESSAARPLPGTDGASLPFWAPDGRALAFFADDGWLKRIDVEGGAVRLLADAWLARGGSWGADGTILFVPATGGVFRVSSAGGGDVTPVTRLEAAHAGHAVPQFLPGGRHFVYYVLGGPEVRGVYVAAMDGSNRRRLVESDTIAAAIWGEHLLFVRDTTLYAQHLDAQRLELHGDPYKVAEGLALELLPVHQAAAISSSASGHIVYRTGSALQGRQFVWFDRSGSEIARIGTPDRGVSLSPALSPDGQIALHRSDGGNTDVWLLEAEGGRFKRFTTNLANDIQPLWSPDGARIVFSSNRTGSYQLYEKSTAGGSEERLLIPMQATPTDWSRDGKFLLVQHRAEKTRMDIWVLPSGTNQKAYPLLQTDFDERDAQFSPEADWITYASTETNRYEIYVRPFAGAGAPIAVSINGGAQPRWRRDGKELFFIGLDGQLMAVRISLPAAGGAVEVGTPVALFATHIGGAIQSGSRTQYFPSADGIRFLLNTVLQDSAPSPITVLMNWKPPDQSR
ncbi:MAG: protein kinase [Acidobacteria bacterium]|nr:protein kinase [Acidobacteriota bacterium]